MSKQENKTDTQAQPEGQDGWLPIDFVEHFLKDKYKFELNKLSYEIEVTDIKTGSRWAWDDINKARLKILLIRQRFYGFKISDGLIDDVIFGIMTSQYNPLNDFFQSLVWDKKDHIQALTNTIKIDDVAIKKMFPTYLKKWLVAAYAQATGQGDNHTCLVLSGAQGRGKTKWLNNLCPQPLKTMVFCGHIDPKVTNNNTANYLAEKLIINIDDQLETMLRQDFNDIKSIITVPNVTNRKAYFKLQPMRPRVASFVASVNSAQFLTDSSNRRYLVVPISDIADLEIVKKININQVWAQAKYLLEQEGFKYWFDKNDITELDSLNESFRSASIEEEMLLKYFFLPTEQVEESFMLQSEILEFLQTKVIYKLNPARLTHALQAAKFKKKSVRINGQPKKVYVVGKSALTDTDELVRANHDNFV